MTHEYLDNITQKEERSAIYKTVRNSVLDRLKSDKCVPTDVANALKFLHLNDIRMTTLDTENPLENLLERIEATDNVLDFTFNT
jgi:hypothetical protein